jgi:HEAT repeat protein
MSEHRPFRFLATSALVAAGCASAQHSNASDADNPAHPIGPIVEATNKPEPIGKLLANLDLQMRAWNAKYLSAQTPQDRNKATDLEKSLITITHKRRAEIIQQLESGPLNNRIVAASALGFTRDPEALSPLLAALEDDHDEVVGNALLGLMLLGQKDTPLDKICSLLQSSPDEGVRRNAAQCLAALVQSGDRAECVLPAARQGLADVDPGVRSQCILVLATLVDRPSVPAICDRLFDDTPLVAAAAARAVAFVGGQSAPDKGTCARALAKAYSEIRGPMRTQMRRALVELAGSDHGNEPEEWVAWASRLP